MAKIDLSDVTFTDLEKQVLKRLLKSSAGNGHDFGFTDEAHIPGHSRSQLAGVISSLVKKDIIDYIEHSGASYDGQFTFSHLHNEDAWPVRLAAMKAAGG